MKKKFDLGIVGGCGHVGLPLSLLFAHRGLKVAVYDLNETTINLLKKGKMPFWEQGANVVLRQVLQKGTLQFFSQPQVISECQNIILIIGTPVDEHLNPQFNLIRQAINTLLPYLDESQTLILRSTVYPGTTRRVADWLEQAGKKMAVVFCPERILEGKAMSELVSQPQIISSFSPKGYQVARKIFSVLTTDLIEVEPLEAELCKLFTNTWRYMKFAIANQFYFIANNHDVDFYQVYKAMTHHYPRAQDLPSPGFAAGPCLLKDAMQLAAFNDNDFYLGHAAMLINEGLPNYIVQKLKEQFNLSKTTVGILGMTFKAESDDVRESLSYKLKRLLEFEAKKVLCSDPFVIDECFTTPRELIKVSKIIIIATPHREYQKLKIPPEKKVVDVWNLLGGGGRI
jgi:UDP-N-acetyl-D-mannosaminuronic acid dehydrogenase